MRAGGRRCGYVGADRFAGAALRRAWLQRYRPGSGSSPVHWLTGRLTGNSVRWPCWSTVLIVCVPASSMLSACSRVPVPEFVRSPLAMPGPQWLPIQAGIQVSWTKATGSSASSSTETNGLRVRGGSGSTEKCCDMIEIDVPENGRAPVADSYSMTPREYRSVR